MQLANYLFFSTGCEEALAFYTECGLGQITQLKRHGADGMPVATDATRGKVMHACFEGPGILFFASDNHDAEPMRGSAHMLIMDDRDSTDSLFARLAEGGKITTPLAVQPWGSYYGKLTDRFGVQWMLDCLEHDAEKCERFSDGIML
ncbi:VOC family protein [Rhizobium ruizarguesonis]|uniref:VOC family protein n=1 Tax=Rhizobium ruizarguesonis TaxID=2081791 RepID=UPI00102FA912|nr:VOC family protein [Rhizobium ruizarguesonis]TBD74603.1 VOC family protein [Rhizobium ruizarguesonis]TBD97080.1 VOC family protein [Rhizobium ruizarguesonis]TBE16301.1 VOC family protein [Rhizobium ruizarguesonis]TBE16985.1 VOC family protein [Rhizobium ruizarguesonis]WSH05007.1 VOC family protein [Rhizobium ruizarguesonis]